MVPIVMYYGDTSMLVAKYVHIYMSSLDKNLFKNNVES